MNTAVTIEIPGLINNKISKKLTFATEGLTIEKPNSYTPAEFTPAPNITGFRYGISFARGYKFVLGRIYYIEIQTDQQKTIRLKLNSYYSIRKKLYAEIWSNVIQQLWESYFVNQYNYYYDLYKIHQTFELCGIQFHFDGIGWDTKNILQWDEIAVSSYYKYFMIYNSNNKKQTKSRSFATDWNAVVLQILLKKIVEERKAVQA
jgi:hypothetical protein